MGISIFLSHKAVQQIGQQIIMYRQPSQYNMSNPPSEGALYDPICCCQLLYDYCLVMPMIF